MPHGLGLVDVTTERALRTALLLLPLGMLGLVLVHLGVPPYGGQCRELFDRLTDQAAGLPRLPQVTPAALAELVRSVAEDVLVGHGLDPTVLPATVTVERPRHPAYGDYATSIALRTAKAVPMPPRELAGWLAEALAQRCGVRTAEVAGPGFVNLRLAAEAQSEIIAQVLAAGSRPDLAGWRVYPSDDLVAAIGMDAARYAVIRSPTAPIDVALWSRRTSDNPLFSVQYAHARLASLARNAADLGISSQGAQLGLLSHQREGELIRTLGEFPRIVAAAAQLREPHRVARYLEQLAGAYHRCYDGTCRVLPLGDEEPGPLHAARLALGEATRQVLANGLGLLGVSAPERI